MHARTQLSVTMASFVAGVAALGRIGWLGEPWPLWLCVALVLASAAGAARLRGATQRTRRYFFAAFGLAGLVTLGVGEVYWPTVVRVTIGARVIDPWNVMVPLAAGMASLLPAFWGARRWFGAEAEPLPDR